MLLHGLSAAELSSNPADADQLLHLEARSFPLQAPASDVSCDLANWPPSEQNGAEISELNFSLESDDERVPSESVPPGYPSPDHALSRSIPEHFSDAGPGARCNESRPVAVHASPRGPELDAARDGSVFISHSSRDHFYAHEAAWPTPASRDATAEVFAVDTAEEKVVRKTFRVRHPAVKFARRLSEYLGGPSQRLEASPAWPPFDTLGISAQVFVGYPKRFESHDDAYLDALEVQAAGSLRLEVKIYINGKLADASETDDSKPGGVSPAREVQCLLDRETWTRLGIQGFRFVDSRGNGSKMERMTLHAYLTPEVDAIALVPTDAHGAKPDHGTLRKIVLTVRWDCAETPRLRRYLTTPAMQLGEEAIASFVESSYRFAAHILLCNKLRRAYPRVFVPGYSKVTLRNRSATPKETARTVLELS